MSEGSSWSRPGGGDGSDGPPDAPRNDDNASSAPSEHHEPGTPLREAASTASPEESDASSEPAAAEVAAPGPAESDSDTAEAAASSKPPAPARRDTSGSAAIAAIGILLLVLSALVAGLVGYLMRDSDESYPADLQNDQYDLAAMALRQSDVPQGMELAGAVEFNNEEWAALIDEVDPEARLPQLNAQQRVRNHISIFGWPDGGTLHLAQTLSLLSQSTLYESEDAAREAITGNALCGLRLNETAPLDEFAVPAIGDETVGFYITETDEQIGKSIETVICFRTGRIVHGVVQSALDGAQDIGLVVSLAERMLVQVDNTFEGNPDPIDEVPQQGG